MKNERAALIQRLNEICDDQQIVAGRGRQTAFAKWVGGTTQQAVRQWFTAETSPSQSRLRAIALKAGVQFEWLATGRGPKRIAAKPTRPVLDRLLHVAEALPDYKVEQAIKIVFAIAESDPPASESDHSDGPRVKSHGRHRRAR